MIWFLWGDGFASDVWEYLSGQSGIYGWNVVDSVKKREKKIWNMHKCLVVLNQKPYTHLPPAAFLFCFIDVIVLIAVYYIHLNTMQNVRAIHFFGVFTSKKITQENEFNFHTFIGEKMPRPNHFITHIPFIMILRAVSILCYM